MFPIARDHEAGGHAKIVACLVNRNKILSYGFNSYTTSHPFQKKWGKNEKSCFWHAETNVIFNALKNDVDIAKCDMYVCRVKKTKPRGVFTYGLAKPCIGCMRCAKFYGVRGIYWSTEKGFGYERI